MQGRKGIKVGIKRIKNHHQVNLVVVGAGAILGVISKSMRVFKLCNSMF
jgi:hypothetical protein